MKTIELEAYIHAMVYSWSPDNPTFSISGSKDMSFLNNENCTYVLVKAVKVTAEVPDEIDYRTARIAALEKEREKIRAELGKRITEITEEISKLTALPFNPTEEDRSEVVNLADDDLPF